MSLTRDQRLKLIDLLANLPDVSDATVRQALLDDLPRGLRDSIPAAPTPALHLRNIVGAVTADAWDPMPDGSRPVVIVIENAAQQVPGSQLATDLLAFRDSIKAGAAASGSASAGSSGPQGSAATNQTATGGVANSGTLGNVQTGSGTQTNINSVQSGRDVFLGSTVNNYYNTPPATVGGSAPVPPTVSGGEIKLDGLGRRRLHEALIAAYPSQADLAQLVAFTLNENLAAIAGGDNLSASIFNLIVWAESRGRLGELITAAAADRPHNADLQALAARVQPGG